MQRAREAGETQQRLDIITAWSEAPELFSERERAAMQWTEALTLVAETHAPDDAYEAARRAFSEKELADLTLLIIAINGWNRLAIGFRSTITERPDEAKT